MRLDAPTRDGLRRALESGAAERVIQKANYYPLAVAVPVKQLEMAFAAD